MDTMMKIEMQLLESKVNYIWQKVECLESERKEAVENKWESEERRIWIEISKLVGEEQGIREALNVFGYVISTEISPNGHVNYYIDSFKG